MAHRFELFFKDVMKTNNQCRKVEDLLAGLFTFLPQKPVEQSHIKEEFLTAGDETPDAYQTRRYEVGLSPF